MIDHPYLIPECNVDTAFVEMYGYKRPNHAPGISQVSSILEKNMTKKRAMGFIDNDKRKPEYFKYFEVMEKTSNAQLFKHPNTHHYLVVVNPDMDTFIFNLCRKLEINLSKYNFPTQYDAFVSFTKKPTIRNNSDFKNLLNTIHQKNSEEISTIRNWIRKYSPYNNLL